jgi:beta-lactam-binding protein with PASTA domain
MLAGGAYALTSVIKPTHPVPNVINKTVADATRTVGQSKLNLRTTGSIFNEDVAPNVILRQDPAPGKKLREGQDVKVVVSRGAAPRAVPDLAGKDQAAAKTALELAGFTPTFQPRFDENVAKGLVLDWTPKEGKQAKGTGVTVIISDGPEPRVVPNLAGKTFDQAAAALTPLRLTAVRADVFNDTVPVGLVVNTSPGAGAKAARDSKVTVNVSKGPELIPLPDVRGKSVGDATAALEAAGFVVDGVQGNPTKPVTNTSPTPGTPVKRGSHVGLYTK